MTWFGDWSFCLTELVVECGFVLEGLDVKFLRIMQGESGGLIVELPLSELYRYSFFVDRLISSVL